MEKFVPVVVIKELGETDKILKALKNNGINCVFNSLFSTSGAECDFCTVNAIVLQGSEDLVRFGQFLNDYNRNEFFHNVSPYIVFYS